MIKHLLTDEQYLYVLPGIFSNDQIEKDFGIKRQVLGSNTHVTVYGFMVADRKQRLLSLYSGKVKYGISDKVCILCIYICKYVRIYIFI